MKKNKGFTLIELVASVVILAIIALIVTPIVNKTIDNMKRSTFLQNVNELVKIMRSEQLNAGFGVAITYTIDGNNINPGISFKKNFEGTGNVTVEADGDISVAIELANKYCAYKALDDTEIIVFNGLCNEAASNMGDTRIVFNYNDTYQRWEVPKDGYYKIDAWGAQGGTQFTRNGGKGAYTSGVIYLQKGTPLYIYVGESPITAKNAFNGGGKGGNSSPGNSGGGATDIRYFGDVEVTQSDLLWDSELGLKSRIMVAGGGGGSSSVITGSSGGYAGLIGEKGKLENISLTDIDISTGGRTIAGGRGSVGTVTANDGIFGQGGDATTLLGGGGGGGYYGGGGGSYSEANGSSGAGGSSYISGYAGVNSLNSNGNHTDNTVHFSGLYFVDTKISINNKSGNGSVIITYLDTTYNRKNTKLNSVRYIKDCINGSSNNDYNQWVEIQAIYNGINVAKGKQVTGTSGLYEGNATLYSYDFVTDGKMDNMIDLNQNFGAAADMGSQCVTVDLGDNYDLTDVAVWHYWSNGWTYRDNVVSISADNTVWTPIIQNAEAESQLGKRYSSYVKDSARVNEKLNQVRYIMDCINGNTVNDYNSWVEIKALKNSINLALQGTINSYDLQSEAVDAPYNRIIDGNTDTDKFGAPARNVGNQCMILDLGQRYDLDEIDIWHYWGDNRTFNNAITYTSSDKISWETVMINESERQNGHRVSAYEPDFVSISRNYLYNFPYVENYQMWVVPQTGYYQIELWGASGGTGMSQGLLTDANSKPGGSGAYTKGTIMLTAGEVLYIQVGGRGTDGISGSIAPGGYNGGGQGDHDHSDNEAGAGGGGSTDIRCFSSQNKCVVNNSNLTTTNPLGLNSRIMVAGGGGGGAYAVAGSYGGALIGGSSTTSAGGTQLGGYNFGLGQPGILITANMDMGGGGGGYYGGNANSASARSGGAGGSSYISGYAGVVSILNDSDINNPRRTTMNTLHYSNKYFINASMIANTNSGDGKAKITYLGLTEPNRTNANLQQVKFIKNCTNGSSSNTNNHPVEIQAIYRGLNVAKGKAVAATTTITNYNYLMDGDITTAKYSTIGAGSQCVVINLGANYDLDEIATWQYWGTAGRYFKNDTTYVSDDTHAVWTSATDADFTWVTVLASSNAVNDSQGRRINAWQ